MAETLLTRTVEKYEASASRLAIWMESIVPEGLTVFDFPAAHRRLNRTSNILERHIREVRI